MGSWGAYKPSAGATAASPGIPNVPPKVVTGTTTTGTVNGPPAAIPSAQRIQRMVAGLRRAPPTSVPAADRQTYVLIKPTASVGAMKLLRALSCLYSFAHLLRRHAPPVIPPASLPFLPPKRKKAPPPQRTARVTRAFLCGGGAFLRFGSSHAHPPTPPPRAPPHAAVWHGCGP